MFIWDEQFHCSYFDKLDLKDIHDKEMWNNFNNIKYNQYNIDLIKKIYKDINIDFTIPNINTIYIVDGGIINFQDLNNFTYITDFFWYHGEDLLDTMILFYDDLPNIINNCLESFWPISHGMEHYFSVFLQKRKVLVQMANNKYYSIIREL